MKGQKYQLPILPIGGCLYLTRKGTGIEVGRRAKREILWNRANVQNRKETKAYLYHSHIRRPQKLRVEQPKKIKLQI